MTTRCRAVCLNRISMISIMFMGMFEPTKTGIIGSALVFSGTFVVVLAGLYYDAQ